MVSDAEQVLGKGDRRKQESTIHQGCFCKDVAGAMDRKCSFSSGIF